MDWREELRKALRLQEADRRCDALRAERHALLHDAQEAALDRDVRARTARIAALEREIADAERVQRLADLERKSAEGERERASRRLYGGEVRTARDAEGLQKNVEGAARRVDELETQILEAMERASGLQQRLAEERTGLKGAAEALRMRREAGRTRLAQVDAELPRADAARAAVAAEIDARVLREYERLRPRCGGIAVASAAGGSCGACGVQLSSYVLARVRSSADAAVTCEQCGRMLVEP